MSTRITNLEQVIPTPLSSPAASPSPRRGTPEPPLDRSEPARPTLSVPVDSGQLKRALRQPAHEARAKNEKAARKAERHARRLPHISNPGSVHIHNDKFDNYALNSKHPVGGNKSKILEQAGFATIPVYDKTNLDLARNIANADPIILQGGRH
jgi:hypothetical protein